MKFVGLCNGKVVNCLYPHEQHIIIGIIQEEETLAGLLNLCHTMN